MERSLYHAGGLPPDTCRFHQTDASTPVGCAAASGRRAECPSWAHRLPSTSALKVLLQPLLRYGTAPILLLPHRIQIAPPCVAVTALFWPVDGRQRLVELQQWSCGRREPAGRARLCSQGSRSGPCQDDACSTRRRRMAMQPSAFAEGGKIDARGGIPPASSIAGAKPQRGLLVAVGNPQWSISFRIPPSRR